MSDETVLVLGTIPLPFGSSRFISQTIQPIDNGDVRRTVNGNLRDMTRVENQKFESQISSTDQATPALAGLWKGNEILVECMKKFRDPVVPAGLAITLIRDPVVVSVFGYVAATCEKILPDTIGGVGNRDITFFSNVDYVEYRPIINFMVLANSINEDEPAAEEGWQIDLEEV